MDDNKKELIKIAKEYISNIEDKINNAKIEDSDLTAIQNMTKKLRDVDVTTKPGIKARKKDVTPEEYADEIFNHIMNNEDLYNRYLESGYNKIKKYGYKHINEVNVMPSNIFGELIRYVSLEAGEDYGKLDTKTINIVRKDLWDSFKEDYEWYAKKKEGNGENKVESKKKMTDEASEFISKKIKYLMDKEDMPQKQAIAVAYKMAEKEGYKVPKKNTKVKADEDNGKYYILDNGGETLDRYTLITKDGDLYGFNSEPYHPQGIGQFVGNIFDKSFGNEEGITVDKWVEGYMAENPNEKEITVEGLPTEDAKRFVMERITDEEKGIGGTVKASEDTQIPDEKAIVLLEDKKTDDLFYVWYDGFSKTYKGTPVNNYRAQIQNERLIKTFTGHNSIKEVIDYAEKYMGLTYVRTKVKASGHNPIFDFVFLLDKRKEYSFKEYAELIAKSHDVNNPKTDFVYNELMKNPNNRIKYEDKQGGMWTIFAGDLTQVKASEGKQVDKVYVIFNDTDVHKYEVGESFVYASEKIVGIVISNGDKVELELEDNGGSTSFIFEVGKNLEGGTYGDDIVTAISETDPRGDKGIKSSDTTLTDKLWDIVMNGMQDETDYYTEFGDDKAVDIIYPKNHKEFTEEEQQGVFAYVIWQDEQGFKNTKIILEEKELESFLKWLGVGEGEEDEEDNDIESNIKELYNVMIEESKVKASDKYTIDDIEYVESNHINPNTKKREWYYTTKDKKYITSMADKQGYSYWMSKPSLVEMGDLSYDYLFVLDSESAKQDAVTLLNKLLNRYSTASVNFKQSEQYKEFRTIVLSMLTKALTDKVIEANKYDEIMKEYGIEASDEEIKEILAKSPTIITVTYDISKLSEDELMNVVPASEFTYGAEGDEVVIRDGTHTVKFVIEADENGVLMLKRKQEIQAGAKQYYILDDTNDKWNISKELKYRLIINDDRGSVYRFKSGADYVLFEGSIYNGTKLDVKEFVDDEVEDGSKIINISELPPADRGIVEEKLKELKIMSSEIKAEDRPPKPENPPQGKKYVWDGTNKDWILVDANA